ncbi:TetR family transcriptional regulator [Algisphaera agarilytica]|uniref:TetR/AcrR family acrAB operon transcriptional repressor/TetR/AcrR family transcriptional repressor of mexAB-oprM operon n=1 Tax=Algisphaera agarilytica TaxID=1385975 RepID=A0A7X0H376_9BACT|nr:TetR family transcriptional regulator [Algisphaera agarilytica]MBB6428248.1 TetR/AcrR family acrAB operon transcriptional repressor/TetR/AcrR family transcriptional repressor of mexAB-oprM operon [Algisphaera agarilytica]
MGLNNREDAEKTRRRIIDAALMLFSKRGYGHTSLEMIAKEVGMTRGAVYGHFKNKLALYSELMQLSQTPLYDIMERALSNPAPPLTALRSFMIEWFELLESNPQHREAFEILLNKTELTEELSEYLESEYSLTQAMVDGMGRLIQTGVEQQALPADTDVRFQALSAYNLLMGATHTWLFNPRLFAINTYGPQLVDQFFFALKRSPEHSAAAKIA